jgi:sporulation protein YlmC with PRC-barrel domain
MTGTARTGKQRGRDDMSNTRSLLTSAMIATAILVSFGTLRPFAQQEVLVSANVAEVGNGYRTSELRGKAVWNDRNQRIGRLTDIVIGRDDVPFAVLEVGGFIGLGAHMVAVPFKVLKIDEPGRRIVLPGATRQALKNFPEFRFRS